MNRMSSVLVLIAIAICWVSDGRGDQQTRLPRIPVEWKFRVGDDLDWSKPGWNDDAWQRIQVGKNWESQGYQSYDGYVWYRVALHIAKTTEMIPELRKYGHFKIALGKIDDVDQVWFNGTPVGTTGKFPPAYTTAWSEDRDYLIPTELVRWDSNNVIAIRVYVGDGDGGLYGGPYEVQVANWSDFVELRIDALGQDGTIRDSSMPPVVITLRNSTQTVVAGTVDWIVEDDEGAQMASGSLGSHVPMGEVERLEFDFTPPGADVYRVRCRFVSAGGGESISAARAFAYHPERIEAVLTKQHDFDEFWQKTRSMLREVDPQFKLIRAAKRDSKTHQVYQVEMRSLGNVRVRGWLEVPIAEGKHPALLRLPGYGENMLPTGMPLPLAVFSFNPRGHGNSQDDVSGMPQDYWLRGLDDKAGYFYQGAYADCLRAVDFLASRSEVDGSRIGVTGGSQGGGLSLATAALDSRITACAPDIPFLCDWISYFKTSDWPEMQEWIDAEPHRSWRQTLRTMSYFDALNLADRVECPVFVGIGMQDEVCPAGTIFAVYNRLPGEKEYRVYPNAGHWVPDKHYDLKTDWFTAQFENENN